VSARTSSGPITVTVKEGMVTIAERTYTDASKMRYSVYGRWPRWIEVALSRVERQHRKRVAS